MFTRRLAAAVCASVLWGGWSSFHFAPRIQAEQSPIGSLEITILSTMLADEGFGEWGFAALADVGGRRILFDTGGHPDTVLRNLDAMKLSLADVEVAVLSHHHDDHTAGLVPLRRSLAERRPRALSTTYVGKGIFAERIGSNGSPIDNMVRLRRAYEAAGGHFVEIDKPTEILPGAWLTGPIPRVHPERNWSIFSKIRTGAELIEDTLPEDSALVFDTTSGLVVLFGCGHAGVINTLEFARKSIKPKPIQALIGGLHLFANDDAALSWTANKLRDLGLRQLVGAHCTGIEPVFQIRRQAGLDRRTCVVGAVGAKYSLETGIHPHRIAR